MSIADISVRSVAAANSVLVFNATNTFFFATQFARSRVQRVDIKFALPKQIMDTMTRGQLNWANEVQEEHMRNGKEVDKETYRALAVVMRRRRGMYFVALWPEFSLKN